MEGTTNKSHKDSGLNVRLDYRMVAIGLLVVVLVMLALWRPWTSRPNANDRTIEVTGQATVTATPDEYVFYPTYEFKNADKQAALSQMSKKSDEVVAKLKELGVADNKIKTNSDGYDYPAFRENAGTPTYTLRLTVTVSNKELAQKVQDYLVSTTPTGSVSPVANFSDKKRNELEVEARNQATKDARSKADQSAKNLGFRISGVKTVNDGAGFDGGIITLEGRAMASDASSGAAAQGLGVQPGENDLKYTVTVTYYIK